ncbi:class I SAM-dependent methyltransferase [Methylosinus sp. Sm6]|uniref:class I SAM-dependent methyltransferase n=1 Tax=Methylosinus sp. Sm6 TaxID=2866948 RepID=UPI001C99E49D|nr:class I SAM-dependent methyltransferase [Methylosinus sp. Sm6]MBY6241127.1 class I SAM-dependent methyltransferase [Methylosinus sp. Sm6]
MTASPREVEAGQAVYTPAVLRLYDLLVLGVSNRYVWKCPTQRLLAHYDAHVTANHLDVGVGTGYFLDRCRFPTASPRVALMDLNENALRFAANRIARYAPKTFRRNVLESIAFEAEPFESIGVNYLLHCLPGSIAEKALLFDHLRLLMTEGAVLFGSTLLQGGVTRSAAARRLMAFYNRKGVFSNEADDLDGLTRALEQCFRDVSIEVVGCAALFSARR